MKKRSFTALALAMLITTGAQTAVAAESTPKANMSSQDEMKKASAISKAGAMKKGSYTTYSPARVTKAVNPTIVLFFHASWCPSCRTSDENFLASATPSGVTLLKVDFDKFTDLKRKYGVTYQHTFVQVNKQGKLIKKWSGSFTYPDLVKQTAAVKS